MIKAVVMGRSTQDFILRKDEADKSWGVLSVASNRRYKKANAETVETDYVSVFLTGIIAENAEKSIKKGTKITAVGDLEINKSTGKDGKEYTNVEMRNAEIQWS